MRFIEDLRGTHKGEIWILGGGRSLCDFPKRFFNKKITIALNWAIIAFPECTYWHGHHERLREYLRDKKPEFLKKSIILHPFPGPFHHKRIDSKEEFFGELVSEPIWMRWRDIRPIPRQAMEQAVECIMAKKSGDFYRASMTVVHTAIQAAAVMGANRIILVGCEHQGSYALCHGMDAYNPRRQYTSDIRVKNGTQWLAEIFGEYGIEVIRYYHKDGLYYKKGYQNIIGGDEKG